MPARWTSSSSTVGSWWSNQPIGANDTSTTAQFVTATAQALGVARALAAAHLTPSQASALANANPLPVQSLQPGTTKSKVNPTSVIGLILVFLMLTQYNTWILMGVMEEKSSRVIEVLMAAVRPIELLSGKVLGIGLVAFGQAALIVAVALGLAAIVGSDLLHGSAPLVVVSTLVWLVLGYAFYCWVYAAAGSMAERQDQVQSLALPLSLPIIFGYIIAITAASTGDASPLLKVLAYLPPTAPFAMPILVGLSAVTWWQFLCLGGHQHRVHRGGGPAGHVHLPAGHPAHRPARPAPRGVRPGRLTDAPALRRRRRPSPTRRGR